MGTGLEMMMTPSLRRACTALLMCSMLVACGNSDNAEQARDAYGLFSTWIGHKGTQSQDPAAQRQMLEQVGRPILAVSVPKTRYASMMTPYGQNRNIETWASGTPETVSLRDGILVATRGFGSDIMSSVAPDVARVRSGSGSFNRTYYYLDGADQPKSLAFSCQFSANGPEDVVIVGLSYPSHRVTEVCANPTLSFQNSYWFDGSGKLRQSDQYVSPQLGVMRLQRVID